MPNINLVAIVVGVGVGSLLNVVIYRLSQEKSFTLRRSQCPSCNKKLKSLDLLPIISWFLLRGRCRYCDVYINKRFPFIEFLTPFLFILSLYSNGFNDEFISSLFIVISSWILISYLVVLCFVDFDKMILPDSLTYSGSLVAFCLVYLFDTVINNSNEPLFFNHILSYFLAFFGFMMFSYLIELIIRRPGLGIGDSKLFAMSGAWLGIDGLEVTIVLSFFVSAIYVVFALLLGFIKRGQYIAFGPFICFSIFSVWILGPQFWYELLGDLFWWRYL